MAQVTNFFVGANSGDGFQNLFGQLVDLEDTYDFMVLKGGPGVGKNTFMRMIGQTMEQAGAAVEVHGIHGCHPFEMFIECDFIITF